MPEFGSIDALFASLPGESLHIECGRSVSDALLDHVRNSFATQRTAYLLETDRGYDKQTVRSYLTFFSRIAGGAITPDEAIAHFGLKEAARTKMERLDHEQTVLTGFARMSLFEPEVCFCERPLADLDAEARATVLTWISERIDAGCVFITTLEPLREALLMPGVALWEEDGRFFVVEQDDGTEGAGGTDGLPFAEDEVRVCKIPAKTDTATLLFDPREIDYIESISKANYLSVRNTLYQTALTMDELETELVRFGFFRCHRSYIVNVQKVAKVERYTRNSFNLTLNNVAHSSVPLAKGRAEEMRRRYGW